MQSSLHLDNHDDTHTTTSSDGISSGGGFHLSLDEIMEQHPTLTDFGIGVFDARRKPASQRAEELAKGREALAAREADVLEVAEWLRENLTPIKTPSIGSYGLKHVVERHIGRYVTNGEAIAAALIVQYPHRYEEDGPNVRLGMSATTTAFGPELGSAAGSPRDRRCGVTHS